MNWALTFAPVENAQEHVILIALADRAHDDGTCAWPSQDWLARRARCSTRTVRRHLKSMEDRGLIRRGDQRHVEHIRSDSRPIVWDLDLTQFTPPPAPDDLPMKTPAQRPDNLSPREPEKRPDNLSARSTGAERPDTGDRSGRTLLSDKPSLEPPHEPSRSGSPSRGTSPARGGAREEEPPISPQPDAVERPLTRDADAELPAMRLVEDAMPGGLSAAERRTTVMLLAENGGRHYPVIAHLRAGRDEERRGRTFRDETLAVHRRAHERAEEPAVGEGSGARETAGVA